MLVGAYNWIAMQVLAPMFDASRGTSTCASLQELEQTQWWPYDQLVDLQSRRLRALIAHVYDHVPFYRTWMRKVGLVPSDVKSAADVSLLPVMTRDRVRLMRAELEADVVPAGRVFEARTGGATGEPLRFTTTTHDVLSRGVARSLRAQSWAGYRVGDPSVGLFEPPRDRTLLGRLRDGVVCAIERRTVLGAADMSPLRLEVAARKVESHPGCFLSGLSSAVYLFALYAQQRGGLTHPPGGIITGGEPLYEYQRETIERVFGIRPLSKYSTTEVLDIASQCHHGTGYHIAAEDVVVEVVDDTGQPCPPGVPGRLIVTNLHNYAMPLLRYDLGDSGVLGQGQCACGRALPLIERMDGRQTDTIVTPDGRRVPGAALPWCFLVDYEVRQVQIVQDCVQSITILLVFQSWVGAETTSRAMSDVRSRYESVLGTSIRLDIRVAHDIPPGPQGKRAFVVSTVADRLRLSDSA